MSKLDVGDPSIIEELTAALEAAGVDGIEIIRPNASLLIRLSVSASGPACQLSAGKGNSAAAPVIAKAPMAGEFWPSDHSRAGAAEASAAVDTIGFLRVGPIMLPVKSGASKRLRRHLVEPGTVVGFGDPIAELEAEA